MRLKLAFIHLTCVFQRRKKFHCKWCTRVLVMSKHKTHSIVEQIDRQADIEIRLVSSSLLYETIV